LGASVTLIENRGIGGAAVVTDCVPSKALVAVADAARATVDSSSLGVLVRGEPVELADVSLDLGAVNRRIVELAEAQSEDIRARLERDGVEVVHGRGVLAGPTRVLAVTAAGEHLFDADVILVATGARPRVLPEAVPDGERILNWKQLYDLAEVPEHLIVVGSGVTGAEFASAYRGLGAQVTLVSSRERVLPSQDADAAEVIEEVFARRGITVMAQSRAAAARRAGDGVVVTLTDGTEVVGSHCLMAVGSVPNTERMGLLETGVRLSSSGFVEVDRVSRTSVRGVYAAGDCTGVMMLASVAAMQGRIAMWHALGDAVAPLDLATVASNVFTTPEIATVGVTEADIAAGRINAEAVTLPLATNARAKMAQFTDGFVKLFARRGTRIIVGGVVVAPGASELIHSVAVAVEQRLTVDEVAHTFTVYPSLSGSIAEAARRLHV
jgi:dihydrolipoamide dehydrogenase